VCEGHRFLDRVAGAGREKRKNNGTNEKEEEEREKGVSEESAHATTSTADAMKLISWKIGKRGDCESTTEGEKAARHKTSQDHVRRGGGRIKKADFGGKRSQKRRKIQSRSVRSH